MILGPAITTFFLSVLKIYKILKENESGYNLKLEEKKIDYANILKN